MRNEKHPRQRTGISLELESKHALGNLQLQEFTSGLFVFTFNFEDETLFRPGNAHTVHLLTPNCEKNIREIKTRKNYLKLLQNILIVGGFLVSYLPLDIYLERAVSSI